MAVVQPSNDAPEAAVSRPEPGAEHGGLILARHVALTAVALSLLAVADALVAWAPTNENPLPLVGAALGLGATAGAALGTPWGLFVVVARRLPRWPRVALWLAGGSAAFLWLAVRLGALDRLGGPYAHLAAGVLAACAAGGLMLGGVGLLFQPAAGASRGVAADARWRYRAPLALILFGCAAGAAWLDRTQFPGTYDEAHAALRVSSLFGTSLVLHLLVRGPWRRPGRRGLALCAALGLMLGALPFALIRGAPNARATMLAGQPLSRLALMAMRTLVDFDGDGHPDALGDADCAPFDTRVGPHAREIPENGLDDNCSGADARRRAIPDAAKVPIPPTPSPTSVVLVTVDTLRPDRMSAYGYNRDTTPALAAWARGARHYGAAYAAGGWTTISLPAMMRGLYPRRLSWTRMMLTNLQRQYRHANAETFQPRKGETPIAEFLLPLSDPNRPLAWYLQRRGVRTLAVTDSGFTEVLAPQWGFGEGFDAFRETQVHGDAPRDDQATTALALELLRAQPDAQPFFLWVHYFGPHAASTGHVGLPRYGDLESDAYDHEIRFLDQSLAPLLAELDRRAATRPLVTIVTADHGEHFYNRRSRGHGRDLGEDNIRVPLLVKGPGFPAGPTNELVSGVDVMPTILALTATPAPPALDGRDLARPAPKNRTIFVDTFTRSLEGTYKVDLNAALDSAHKAIFDRQDGTAILQPRGERKHPNLNLLPSRPKPALQRAQMQYLENCGGPPDVVE